MCAYVVCSTSVRIGGVATILFNPPHFLGDAVINIYKYKFLKFTIHIFNIFILAWLQNYNKNVANQASGNWQQWMHKWHLVILLQLAPIENIFFESFIFELG